MEDLKELISVVTRNKTKRIEIIGNPTNYASNLQKLYQGIADGQFQNDGEAISLLFANGNDQAANFKRLKRRLSQRLVNSLFFIDLNQPNFNDFQRAYYSCYKDFAALKILIGRSARKAAISLGERILKIALHYEFTDLAVNVLRELRLYYGSLAGDVKKFKEYNDLLLHHFHLWEAELQAEEFYVHLIIHYIKSKATNSGLEETAKTFAEQLEKYDAVNPTQRFILYAYSVFSLRYEVVNDYRNTLKVSQEAISLLEKKDKLVSKTNLFTFWLKAANCHIQLGEFEQGETALTQCLELTEEEFYNWYTVKEAHLVLLYRSGQYQKAFGIYLDAYARPGFKKLPETYREQWSVHEAFLHYFISIEKIKPGLKDAESFGKFRLTKFLNDVPVFSKDKRGMNISILILQTLFLIQQKRFDEANDRLNALKAYSHRYLRKDDTFRSNCFIHMLLQLPHAYFNRKAAERKAKKFADQLSAAPLAAANQSGELELVPYENLWQFVLSSLKG